MKNHIRKYKAYYILLAIITVSLGAGMIIGANAFPITEVKTEYIYAEKETESKGRLLGEFEATAYCSCVECCNKSDGITATGTIATAGRTIAVDPDVIPYGTKVIIDGHTYIAEDCGAAIKGNRVDIFFDSHYKALEYGKKTVDVFIVSE